MGKMKELYTAMRSGQQLSDAERDYISALTPEELAEARSSTGYKASFFDRKRRDEHLNGRSKSLPSRQQEKPANSGQ